MATEAWEFQSGHADLINRQLRQKLQGMCQQFERDAGSKRSAIKETEAKAQAQEDRITQLQAEIRKEKALLQELEANEAKQGGRGTPEARAKPRQGYPTGSVTSPPVKRRHPTTVGWDHYVIEIYLLVEQGYRVDSIVALFLSCF